MRGNQYHRAPLADRFWEKVARGSAAECWNWTAYRNRDGYGRFLTGPKSFASAHRMAWELTNGPIPDGCCVCHECDNRACCNPAHLFVGTWGDNNRDRTAKGRTVSANAMKTHCKRGHAFTPDNITWNRGGRVRKCRACARMREQERRQRRDQARHTAPRDA